jgi:methenyltetrahydromethanopterin cyclohydrolase
MIDFGMNERAWKMADDAVERAAELRIRSSILANGARVIDAGINIEGGLAAGILLSELCMGGLGHVSYTPLVIDGITWSGVQVWTDHPAQSLMASQYAGWVINPDGFFAMGSGPLRARARVETDLFARLGYAEDAARGVLVLESRTLPTEAVAEWVGNKAGLAPSALTFAVAPTASLAGGVQVVSRVIETGLHKLDVIGFDVRRIVNAMGTAIVPPVAGNDLKAIGRTNDCVLYGSRARYTLHASDEELRDLSEKLPASVSRDYGLPFYEILKKYNNDFYKVDPMLFSPAEVLLASATTGRTFRAGRLNLEVLKKSFGVDDEGTANP